MLKWVLGLLGILIPPTLFYIADLKSLFDTPVEALLFTLWGVLGGALGPVPDGPLSPFIPSIIWGPALFLFGHWLSKRKSK
jgi:hypothetical protein